VNQISYSGVAKLMHLLLLYSAPDNHIDDALAGQGLLSNIGPF